MSTKFYWVGQAFKRQLSEICTLLKRRNKISVPLYTYSYIYRPFWVEFSIRYLNVALLNKFELVKYGTRKVVLFLWW